MTEETQIAYAYWITALQRAFPDMEPFAQPIDFIKQLNAYVRRKENAALQRAINVIRGAHADKLGTDTRDAKACMEAIRLIRFCMRADDA